MDQNGDKRYINLKQNKVKYIQFNTSPKWQVVQNGLSSWKKSKHIQLNILPKWQRDQNGISNFPNERKF